VRLAAATISSANRSTSATIFCWAAMRGSTRGFISTFCAMPLVKRSG
jgi:hypothetical protein